MELMEKVLERLKQTTLTVGKIELIRKDGTRKEIQISDIPKIKKQLRGKKRK